MLFKEYFFFIQALLFYSKRTLYTKFHKPLKPPLKTAFKGVEYGDEIPLEPMSNKYFAQLKCSILFVPIWAYCVSIGLIAISKKGQYFFVYFILFAYCFNRKISLCFANYPNFY